MAKSKKSNLTFTDVKQFSSMQEIDRAIQKLRTRITDVESLARDNVAYDDQRVSNAENDIRNSVLDIFGPNSPEYGEVHEERWWGIFPFPTAVILGDGEDRYRDQQRRAENQAGFRKALPDTITMLEGLVRRLEEKSSDFKNDPGAGAKVAFEEMDLHPRIAGACTDLYRDGHFKQAVLEASIALVNCVKEKSRQHALDGSKLMTTVFSANSPILAFNELKDQTDRDEQEGFMHLFIGAVLGLRNPRAHALFDDSPELALDYIAFLSMLAKRLDGAKRVSL